jgi:hypothetical protein
MIINPFIGGILCTLFTEMAAVIIIAILLSIGGKK